MELQVHCIYPSSMGHAIHSLHSTWTSCDIHVHYIRPIQRALEAPYSPDVVHYIFLLFPHIFYSTHDLHTPHPITPTHLASTPHTLYTIYHTEIVSHTRCSNHHLLLTAHVTTQHLPHTLFSTHHLPCASFTPHRTCVPGIRALRAAVWVSYAPCFDSTRLRESPSKKHSLIPTSHPSGNPFFLYCPSPSTLFSTVVYIF